MVNLRHCILYEFREEKTLQKLLDLFIKYTSVIIMK